MNYGVAGGLAQGLGNLQQIVGGYFATKQQREQQALEQALNARQLAIGERGNALQAQQIEAATTNQQAIRDQEEKRLLMEQASNMAPGQYSAEQVAPFTEKGVYMPLFTENAHPGLKMATSLQSQGEAPAFESAGDVSFQGVMPPALRSALASAEQRAAAAEANNDYRYNNLERMWTQGGQQQSTMAALLSAQAAMMNALNNQRRTGNDVLSDIDKAVDKFVSVNYPTTMFESINPMSPKAQEARDTRMQAAEAYRQSLLQSRGQGGAPKKSGLF